MKAVVKRTVLSVMLLVSVLSCSRKEDSWLLSRGEGILNIDFGYDLSVVPVSKAGSEPVFRIDVYNARTGVIVRTVEDHRTLETDPLILREGRYLVKASNGEYKEAAFDSPYYTGEAEVEIVAGQEANVSITCTLANVKVTVSVSDELKKNFTSYSVTVSNGNDGGALIYSSEDGTFSNEGYFNCTGKLTWTLSVTNTDGVSNQVVQDINNVEPRDYYNIHFDVDGSGSSNAQGGTSIRVTVDDSVNEKEYVVDINLNKLPEPVLTEDSGADLTQELRAPRGAGIVGLFHIEAKAGVARVVLTHKSEQMLAAGIPASINLKEADPTLKAALNGMGLTWTDFEVGAVGMDIDMRQLLSSCLEVGTYPMAVNVLDCQDQYVSTAFSVLVVPDVEVSMRTVNAWARFADVRAQYNTESEPAGMGFQFRKASESAWTDFAGPLAKDGVIYSARISGLEPETEYQVRAVTANEQSEDDVISFTTEAAEQLPNFNFDTWSDNGHTPNAEGDAFWDSGNAGASTLGKYPTSQETSYVVSGSAAKLASQFVGIGSIGKFAGGNIYSGQFVELVGMNGAKIDFGQPYTSRPTALCGWYSYSPVPIDYSQGDYSDLKGSSDICQIYVALTDWAIPFRVNNAEGTLFDPKDPSVIAYGTLEDNVGTGGEYKEFTIELEYRDTERRPTHVLVVATASKYADYFTGGNGSVLYIDEFEFLFE